MDALAIASRGKGTDARSPGIAAVLVIIVLVVLSTADQSAAQTIVLRREATVAAAQVRLGDVALLTAGAEEYASIVVVSFTAGGEVNVSVKEIHEALARHGVNKARVEVKGFEVCRVTRVATEVTAVPPQRDSSPAATEKPPASKDSTSPVLANPSEEIGRDSRLTVRDHLLAWLEQWTGAKRDELRITFADRDAKELDRAVLSERIAIVPGGSSKLGRVPVSVERYVGSKLTGTSRITFDVARRQLVVVARKGLSKGDLIDVNSVEVREMHLDRDRGPLPQRIDDVTGLIAATTLREGSVIATSDIAPALLVRKNENIRIRVHAGGLMVQMVGRALEDGGMGQIISVRNERSHETFLIEVNGLRCGTVIADESPVKTGARSDKAPTRMDKAPARTERAAAQR